MNTIAKELQKKHITEDMAARLFIEIFDGGNDDIMEYLGRADEVITAEINSYVIAVFADGSVYDDTQQGISRFFPSLDDWFEFHGRNPESLLGWYPRFPAGLNV